MNKIQPLWTEPPITKDTSKAKRPEPMGNPFTDIFHSAIDAVKTTDAEKTQMEYLMATGQLDNPSLLTIASTKAQLSVDLLVQLRNKSMEAYNELMRTNL